MIYHLELWRWGPKGRPSTVLSRFDRRELCVVSLGVGRLFESEGRQAEPFLNWNCGGEIWAWRI